MTTETIRIFVEIDAELVAWIESVAGNVIPVVKDARWQRAIRKAADYIAANPEIVSWHAESATALIASPQSGATYEANAAGCQCEAFQSGKPCWHRAAGRLIQRAIEARSASREAAKTAALAVAKDADEARAERMMAWRLADVRARHRSWRA